MADLADPASRELLTRLSLAGGKAYLPLLTAPVSSSTHVLEVYTPDRAEPLVLFAEPLGGPTAVGFPLRLRPYDPGGGGSGERPRMATSVTQTERPADAEEPEPHWETPQVAAPTLVGRAIAGGKLSLESVIGAGGVGSVYRATHRDLQIPVAVKILHQRFQQDLDFCNRFHAEALAASGLDHPNLVRVLDFGQEADGLLYLAMEHLDGAPLADLVRDALPLGLPRIVNIMMQVCAGLAHAHQRGIVHRDVKPDNVMIVKNDDDDGRPSEIVKVCDFGIALTPGGGGAASSSLVGTPDYMSPEQCRNEPLDGRSDVYACGVVLYELVTGQKPFAAPDTLSLLDQHMFVVPDPPSARAPELDPRLDALIVKALAKDPNERQASMRELRRELRALLQAPGERTAASTAPPPRSQIQPALRGFRPEADTGPEWLERGGSSYRHDSISGVSAVDVTATLLAGELAMRPAAWLAAFAVAAREEQLTLLAHRLAAAIPLLVAEQNVRTLFAVRCTLDELAADDGRHPAWRSEHARQLLLLLTEPALLAGLAEAVLSCDRPAREATELLLRAGTPGAYALYSARLKLHEMVGVRRRFVLLVRELGALAMPMIRAGLARLEARRSLDVATALAYDLLRASPHQQDDAAGEVTALYLERSAAPLVAAAAEALAWFWEQRAMPLLVGLLASEDDSVRVVCIDAIRQLRVIDQYAVTRILAAARTSTSTDVRIAARSAFLETVGPARMFAERALEQLESDERGVSW